MPWSRPAIGLVYYFAPDAEQDFVWLTPGSVLATVLWILFSLGFKIYVANFTNYNETYGAIGGVIVLLLWFYTSGLAILIGAEMNAEIEHASPYGKDPGEKVPGEKKKIGLAAWRHWRERKKKGEPVGPPPPEPARPASRRRPTAARPPARWCSAGSLPARSSSFEGSGGSGARGSRAKG